MLYHLLMTRTVTGVDSPEQAKCRIAEALLKARDAEITRVEDRIQADGRDDTEYATLVRTDALTRTMPLTNILNGCASCEVDGTMTAPTCAVEETLVTEFIRKAVASIKPQS